jgi:hypothetical protein
LVRVTLLLLIQQWRTFVPLRTVTQLRFRQIFGAIAFPAFPTISFIGKQLWILRYWLLRRTVAARIIGLIEFKPVVFSVL